MEKIIIYGTTQFSIMCHKFLVKEKVAEVIAYTVNEKYLPNYEERFIEGIPIVAFEKIEESYCPSKYKILNTIGYTKMNRLRQEKYNECVKKGYEMFSFVSKDATVLSEIKGVGNIILPGSFLGYDVTLGSNNVIYTGCVLTHDIKIGNYNFIAAASTIGGNVVIGNNCFIGMNSTIKNRLKVDDYSLIGASTYLSKDTEKYGVYVPERFKKLDKLSIDLF